MRLRVKTQFRPYEPGEFDDNGEHSYEETIALIQAFPWQSERDHLRVDFTCPSITIEGPYHNFIKLGLFYHEKFVLYYLDSKKNLYIQSFTSIQDAFPDIHRFFDQAPSLSFDPAGFKRENTWLRSTGLHFNDGNFNYRVRYLRLIPSILFLLIYFAVSVVAILSLARIAVPASFIILYLFPFSFAMLIIAVLSLFLNHYRLCKDKVLVLSRGRDEFYYGPSDSPELYSKKEIDSVITYGRQGRGGYPMLTRVEINYKNGTSLNLSCLMIDRDDLVNKFPAAQLEIKKRTFPFIPRGD